MVAEISNFWYFEVFFPWRSSSIGERLCFNHFWFWFGPLISGLKFEKDPASGYWYIQFLIFWGPLLLVVVFIFDFVWSTELKFQIWERSDQWLLRYSIGGCLWFKHFWFWFGPLNLSLKFEKDPASGCWNILLLIFWGCLQLEVIFVSGSFDFGFVPQA